MISEPSRPLLVIVSGAPGGGKTTLARRLGAALGLPVLCKDDLKEILYDTLGAPDLDESARLGRAAFALLHAVTGRLLDSGVGAVLEANFWRGIAEPDLAVLAGRSHAVQVHCGGDPNTIVRRYRARAERGERHPDHQDLASVSRLQAGLASGLFEPLDLGAPHLRVDTTLETGYAPGFEGILAFIAAHGTGCRHAPSSLTSP